MGKTGFFAETDFIGTQKSSLIPKCGACGIYKTCQTPKMEVKGKGRRKILVVGAAPSKTEDKRGTSFSDPHFEVLKKTMASHRIDLYKDCWRTNALICSPWAGVKSGQSTEKWTAAVSAAVREDMIDYCRANLLATIKRLNPVAVLLLGKAACDSLLVPYFDGAIGPIKKWRGWKIPLQPLNCWVFPNYHPSYVAGEMEQGNSSAEVLFEEVIENLADVDSRPWKKVPDYKKEITIIRDPKDAAKAIDWMRKRGGVIAPDFEANCLKPEYPKARIISCAVCWEGKKTIAYPFHGDAIKATQKLLRSDSTRKIASNLKFEDRWCRYFLGGPVVGWAHDTMLQAHQIDNRVGSKGLKFQAFVNFGFPPYDTKVANHITASIQGRYNTLDTGVNLRDLLMYNGLDSLLEYLLAVKQRKQLGLSPSFGVY